MKNLFERGHSSTEREIAHDVKEKLVYIVVEYDTELKSTVREKTCELPDGNIIRKNMYANVVLSHRETELQLVSITTQSSNLRRKTTRRKPPSSQTETSSPMAPNVAVTRKRCSCQAPPVMEPADSTTLLSSNSRSVMRTSARSCSPMSCRQVDGHVQRDRWAHDEGGVDSFTMNAKVVAPPE